MADISINPFKDVTFKPTFKGRIDDTYRALVGDWNLAGYVTELRYKVGILDYLGLGLLRLVMVGLESIINFLESIAFGKFSLLAKIPAAILFYILFIPAGIISTCLILVDGIIRHAAGFFITFAIMAPIFFLIDLCKSAASAEPAAGCNNVDIKTSETENFADNEVHEAKDSVSAATTITNSGVGLFTPTDDEEPQHEHLNQADGDSYHNTAYK